MKYLFVVVLAALSGCAANPGQWRDDIGLSSSSDTDQEGRTAANMALISAGLQVMQASQPYTLPQQPQGYQPRGNAYVTGYLRSNSQNGTLRLCNYSNGAVITVASHQMCPNSTN